MEGLLGVSRPTRPRCARVAPELPGPSGNPGSCPRLFFPSLQGCGLPALTRSSQAPPSEPRSWSWSTRLARTWPPQPCHPVPALAQPCPNLSSLKEPRGGAREHPRGVCSPPSRYKPKSSLGVLTCTPYLSPQCPPGSPCSLLRALEGGGQVCPGRHWLPPRLTPAQHPENEFSVAAETCHCKLGVRPHALVLTALRPGVPHRPRGVHPGRAGLSRGSRPWLTAPAPLSRPAGGLLRLSVTLPPPLMRTL